MSKIEWTDETWNPITGCSVLSTGCEHCYAMRMAGRGILQAKPQYTGLVNRHGKWTGEVRFNESVLHKPLAWKKPRRIFVCSMGDLFHENVPLQWILDVFDVMKNAPQHTFQVLTKRSDRMRAVMDNSVRMGAEVLPNVWLGVSAEDQGKANIRVPDLLNTPAAVRFVSAEPLLNFIDMRRLNLGDGLFVDAMTGFHKGDRGAGWSGRLLPKKLPHLDQLIVGGESGPGARPVHLEWVRSLRDQTAIIPCAFFFKQWGDWLPGENLGHKCVTAHQDGTVGARYFKVTHDNYVWWDRKDRRGSGPVCDWPGMALSPIKYFTQRVGKKKAGRLLDGRTWDEYPQAA